MRTLREPPHSAKCKLIFRKRKWKLLKCGVMSANEAGSQDQRHPCNCRWANKPPPPLAPAATENAPRPGLSRLSWWTSIAGGETTAHAVRATRVNDRMAIDRMAVTFSVTHSRRAPWPYPVMKALSNTRSISRKRLSQRKQYASAPAASACRLRASASKSDANTSTGQCRPRSRRP